MLPRVRPNAIFCYLMGFAPSNPKNRGIWKKLRPIMAKPILLSVDDDSDVLRAIERDLRSKYGAEYRVIGSDSPEGALTLLKQLRVRNDSVALLLADQRIRAWTGWNFCKKPWRSSLVRSGLC